MAKKTLLSALCHHLFSELEDEENKRIERAKALEKSECWYLIISVDDDGILCCELSHPKAVSKKGKFKGFHERVMVFKYGEFKSKGNYRRDNEENQKDDIFEIKPVIRKK